MEIAREALLDAYRQMRMIRSFEEKLEELVKAGKLGGFLHLYAGEEAVAVGVCANLSDTDIVTSTHRGHGHCIAKGVDINGMMAELFGRIHRCTCKGKGGSMHIADMDLGMLGANGIVGAWLADDATGAALTAQIKRRAATSPWASSATARLEPGAVPRVALNIASNLEASGRLRTREQRVSARRAPTEYVTPMTDLGEARRPRTKCAALVADGMDFFDVYEKSAEAIARARAGEGPTLLECKTYRFMGHFVGDPLVYRHKEEAEDWIQNKDPLQVFEAKATEAGLLSSDDLRSVDGDVQNELAEAVEDAQNAPFPNPEDVLTDVYAE